MFWSFCFTFINCDLVIVLLAYSRYYGLRLSTRALLRLIIRQTH